MLRKNREKNSPSSTKQPPSATGGRLTRLAQAFALLAAVKLAAICVLWLPAAPPAPAPQPGQTILLSVQKPGQAAPLQDALLRPVVIREAMAADAAPPASAPAESGNATNATAPKSEADQWLDLNARQVALDKKEAELRTLEAEVDAKLTKLKELEVRMQNLIDSAGSLQEEKMAHLIDVYSNMKPKQAAQVLETLDEPIAVRILAGMSGRKAGEILSSVRADRAAALSESLTRLQTGETGK